MCTVGGCRPPPTLGPPVALLTLLPCCAATSHSVLISRRPALPILLGGWVCGKLGGGWEEKPRMLGMRGLTVLKVLASDDTVLFNRRSRLAWLLRCCACRALLLGSCDCCCAIIFSTIARVMELGRRMGPEKLMRLACCRCSTYTHHASHHVRVSVSEQASKLALRGAPA